MRWFKHFADSRHNPKLIYAEEKLGEAAYGRWFKLLELVSGRATEANEFKPEIDLTRPETSINWVATQLKLSKKVTRRTLDVFGTVRLINPTRLQENAICVPQLLEYKDQFTARRMRSREPKSTHPVRTECEPSTPSDTDTDGEKRESRSADACSRPGFVKPSIEEIGDYMASIGMSDPDSQARAFYDRNEERGWIPSGSRTQMRDWNAACRTWKRNAPRFGNASASDDEGYV